MEGMRAIATAYYERAGDKEKGLAENFFRKLDVNGDGKVSLPELKKSVGSSWVSNESVFKQLDRNRDGTLDFYEVLAVYYMAKKVDPLVCDGCRGLLAGPYFSCLLCLGKGNDTFDLCCACYRSGKIAHEHAPNYLLDHHSLLSVLRKRSVKAETSHRKREMEELREIARAHYRACSPQVQALACEFYRSLDIDGDGRVDLSEFLAFMRQQGYSQMRCPHFFSELDHHGNGTLDFSDVMTLYYIIKSGRPFCDGCGRFIPGTFFSCAACYKTPAASFDLCPDCYGSAKYRHDHDGRTQFLDNYTLLEATRNSALASMEGRPIPSSTAVVPHPYYANMHMDPSCTAYTVHPPTQVPNHPNAIVPAASNKWYKGKVALQAFEVALSIGQISSTACTIL